MHQLSDFDFELPTELIAQHPAPHRADSRLLVVGETNNTGAEQFQDRQFRDIMSLLNPGDLLVFNDSRVIPARLYGTKATGGRVEILIERIVGTHEALALLRVSKKPTVGATIRLARSHEVLTVLGRDNEYADRFRLKFSSPVLQVLEGAGELPLPPYISHHPDARDIERYQTVYARTPGSVAAPTAGLHFDEQILAALKAKGIKIAYVTLHVGSGTFAPVKTENLDAHRMHSEWYEISQETANLVNQTRCEGGRIIAVGTTSLRTLESAGLPIKPGAAETSIFIRPGYVFQVVDALLTNFHLPRSTLLMLVAAFIGYDKMQAAYRHAIQSRYRFFSYGDAMLCSRQEGASKT